MNVIGCNVRCIARKSVGSRNKCAGVRKDDTILLANADASSMAYNFVQIIVFATSLLEIVSIVNSIGVKKLFINS